MFHSKENLNTCPTPTLQSQQISLAIWSSMQSDLAIQTQVTCSSCSLPSRNLVERRRSRQVSGKKDWCLKGSMWNKGEWCFIRKNEELMRRLRFVMRKERLKVKIERWIRNWPDCWTKRMSSSLSRGNRPWYSELWIRWKELRMTVSHLT